ncbi:MAG TPA: hypothetical protein VGM76_06335 [Lacipirellulaceae bacterium]|jgi:hypothetical protein
MLRRFGLSCAMIAAMAVTLGFVASTQAGWRHGGWRFGRSHGYDNRGSAACGCNQANSNDSGRHETNYAPAYDPQQAPEPPQMSDQGISYQREDRNRDDSNRSDADSNTNQRANHSDRDSDSSSSQSNKSSASNQKE